MDRKEIGKIFPAICMRIPRNHFGWILPKSGLATQGIHVLARMIDSSYQGEVIVTFQNLSEEPIQFCKR